MSEIEPVSQPPTENPRAETDGTDILHSSGQTGPSGPTSHSNNDKEDKEDSVGLSNGSSSISNGVSAPATSTTTSTVSTAPVKRFSSATITKKFLTKHVSASSVNSTSSPTASSSPSPAATKAAPSPVANKQPAGSTGTSRLVTTKLTQTSGSSTPKWNKESPGATPKTTATGLDNVNSKLPGSQPAKPAPSINRNKTSPGPTAGKVAWGAVPAAKTNTRMQSDFPTATELKNRADKAAAESAAIRQSLTESADAFRGVHLDPKAQHWDEMTEEDSDFLNETIDFGDGKQYQVAPVAESEQDPAQKPPAASGDRLGDNYDRSWPPKEPPPPSAVSVSSVSPLSSKPPGERFLFNERHNRMEPPPQSRQQPTTSPTLLHANPTPASVRGSAPRRGSFNKGGSFRDSTSWNSSQRGITGESDRERDNRGRHPSEHAHGLGPHLRDRSPDSSGRFPGRNIPPNARRNSQASSGMVTRPGRDHSRESSDRGSISVRQLPPHLSGSRNGLGNSPSGPPSSATRTSWRDSRGTAPSHGHMKSPLEPPQELATLPNGVAETKTSPDPVHAAPKDDDAIAAAALLEDETALKAAMAVAAERARKRRQEEEEGREQERQRAKRKLEELEARLQAQEEAKKAAQKEKEEQERKEKEEKELQAKLEAERAEKAAKAEKEKKEAERINRERPPVKQQPPPRPPMPADRVDSWRAGPPKAPATNNAPSSQPVPKPEPRSAIGPKSPEATRKPLNTGPTAEVTSLQSKPDEKMEVLDFADLRQLAEEYSQTHPTDVGVGNSSDGSSKKPVVKLPGGTRSHGPSHTGQDAAPASAWRKPGTDPARPHSPTSSQFAESKGFKASKPSSKTPAPLNLAPRDAHEQHGPPSGGLGSARSPRTADSHGSYREAPISVLDDTLSRFKQALMASNPNHAGMSSVQIMEGLGKNTGPVGEIPVLVVDSSSVVSTNAVRFIPDLPNTDPQWAQSQSPNEEDQDGLNVLIPTFSLRRDSIHPKKIQAMKMPMLWRWDLLTFDPPVLNMNKKTLSVMDALRPKPAPGPVRVQIRIPGSRTSSVSLPESSQPNPSVIDRPRRGENKVNGVGSTPAISVTTPSSKPTTSSMWPPKSKGADEGVWRRAVPISQATPTEDPAPSSSNNKEETASPATPKSSSLSAKHGRAFSIPSPVMGTPPPSNSTWGRSPLSLTVTEALPEDPDMKAAWNKASAGASTQSIKNSLKDLADEPPPVIPSSINDIKSDDGDGPKAGEKVPTPPVARAKYDPHRAFQQVGNQPASIASAVQTMASPVSSPMQMAITEPPRTNALALTTNRTPRLGAPMMLPPMQSSMNPPPLPRSTSGPGPGSYVPYPSPMLPVATPYPQPMMPPQQVPQQYTPGTPIMAPPTPGMIHRTMTPAMQMQPGSPNVQMWAPPTPGGPPSQLGYIGRGPVPGAPMPQPLPYQSPMMQHAGGQPMQLYMPQSTNPMHPPSPGVSPMLAPGMAKPLPVGVRQRGMSGGAHSMPPPPLPVSVPVGFQLPQPSAPQGQMPYMMGGPPPSLHAPHPGHVAHNPHPHPHQPHHPHQQHQPQLHLHAPQNRLPQAPQGPQGRGMPFQSSPYQLPPPPNGYARNW